MNTAMIRRRQLMNMVKTEEAEGNPVVFNTNTVRGLAGLQLYGASIQDGTPTIENPVDWTNKGSSGQVNVSVTGTGEQPPQSLIVLTPNGLPGIPVSSGGNYTDKNGQQWIADYVDYESREYVQCVYFHIVTENDADKIALNWETETSISYSGRILTEKSVDNKEKLCNYFSNSYPYRINVSDTNCYFEFEDKNTMPTLNDFISFLKSNEVKILYILGTPIRTPLSEEQIQAFKAIHANAPITTIMNDADVWMKAKYKVRR